MSMFRQLVKVSYRKEIRAYSIKSSTSSKNIVTSIPHDELVKLNRTSAQLYRILLKYLSNSESFHSPGFHDDFDKGESLVQKNSQSKYYIMLQPKLKVQDYGQARILGSEQCSMWPKNDDNKTMDDENKEGGKKNVTEWNILSFFDQVSEEKSDDASSFINKIRHFRPYYYNNDDNGDIHSTFSTFSTDQTLLVSKEDLQNSLRSGFLRSNDSMNANKEDQGEEAALVLQKSDILNLQRSAIDSIQLMDEQRDMWRCTSINTDWDRKIRVVATSRCIGVGTTGNQHASGGIDENIKYRFAYRIRIENFSDDNEEDNDIDTEDSNVKYTAVQLLGRTWHITEDKTKTGNGSLDENDNGDDEDDGKIKVHAPTTGAVGHLPVIESGEIFEYISGCELGTKTGSMGGQFHMAWVDDETESAQVGDPVDALHLSEDEKFQVDVETFRLNAE